MKRAYQWLLRGLLLIILLSVLLISVGLAGFYGHNNVFEQWVQ